MRSGVLHITYDGLLEPLGRSQVASYALGLGERGHPVHLLSFEKARGSAATAEARALAERLRRAGVAWRPLAYHRRPAVPATLYDAGRAIAVGGALVRRHRLTIVHARSYVAALVALTLKELLGTRFLFDMRGFWADERVDAGLWTAGSVLYRAVKRLERAYLDRADHVVTLTDAARAELKGLETGRVGPPVTVIPTCVDLDHFRPPAGRPYRGQGSGAFTLVYSGSLGTWYRLDAMMGLFRALTRRIPGARFLVLTPSSAEPVKAAARAAGVEPGAVEVRAASYAEMPAQLVAGDAGIMLSTPSWANKARCPTKLGELLACGLPVVASRGLGDSDVLLERERVGVAVDGLGDSAFERAADALLTLREEPGLAERCRRTAERHFALTEGVRRYASVYERLAEGAGPVAVVEAS
jgi:glycosyltransferase involved in cell wall biosynthesis